MWILFKLLYFMLPAYLANMTPVFVKKINFLGSPIDFGTGILGGHKTWRGFLFAVIISTTVFSLQKYIGGEYLIDYSNASLWIGVLFGVGVIMGDCVKSFFKRKFNIAPGKSWIPFDQIDFTIGALLFVSIIYFPGWINALIVVIVSGVGHVLINHLGYYLRIRDVKF